MKLRDAGCAHLVFGIESFSAKIMKRMGKPYSPELRIHLQVGYVAQLARLSHEIRSSAAHAAAGDDPTLALRHQSAAVTTSAGKREEVGVSLHAERDIRHHRASAGKFEERLIVPSSSNPYAGTQ